MKPTRHFGHFNSSLARSRPGQRGVVLLFSLIALVVMLVAAVAMVRSFNTSLFTAGNIAFKRDLLNQGERVVPVVLATMQTGVLSTGAARAASLVNSNYSATILASNAQGIPLALLGSDADFTTFGRTANDIVVPGQQVTLRYVVDRLCDSIGLDTALGADHCNLASDGAPRGGSGSDPQKAENASGSGGGPVLAGAVQQQVVYRLSIRVTGPRSTQAFFQTTFTL
jgi:type IV pilus assembly protein PilX